MSGNPTSRGGETRWAETKILKRKGYLPSTAIRRGAASGAGTLQSLDFCFCFVLMAAMSVRRLVDSPYVLVRLRCDVCKRRRLPARARLAVKYGAEILLDDLIVRLSADCPWRDEPRGSCGARFADLPPARPPDLPPALLRLRVVKGVEGLRDAIVGHFNGGSALKPQHGTRQPMMPVHLIRIGRSAQPVSL